MIVSLGSTWLTGLGLDTRSDIGRFSRCLTVKFSPNVMDITSNIMARQLIHRCKVTHTTSKFMAIRSQLVTSSSAQFMSTSIWTSLALVSPGSLGSQG